MKTSLLPNNATYFSASFNVALSKERKIHEKTEWVRLVENERTRQSVLITNFALEQSSSSTRCPFYVETFYHSLPIYLSIYVSFFVIHLFSASISLSLLMNLTLRIILSLYLPCCLFYLSTSISLWILIHLNIGIILSLCFSFFVMYLSLCLNFSFDTNTFKCKYHFLSLSYNLFPSLSFLYFYRNCSFITITFKYRYQSLSLSFSWCYIFLSTSISLSILIRSNIGIILCLSFLNCLFIFLPQLLFQYLYI